jgi:hypothetical protein
MLNVEIRFVMQGKEVSVDSFVGAILPEILSSVREEISWTSPSMSNRVLTLLGELTPRCRVRRYPSERRRGCYPNRNGPFGNPRPFGGP